MKVQHYGEVSAGKVVAFPTDRIRTVEIPLTERIKDARHAVAYTVCGDCLETDDPHTSIYDGDTIIARTVFEKSEVCGRICILRIYGNELLAKRVGCNEKQGTLTLLPSNPRFVPITLPVEEVEILAIVVEFIRNI